MKIQQKLLPITGECGAPYAQSLEKIKEQGFGNDLLLLYKSDMIDYMALQGKRFSPFDMPTVTVRNNKSQILLFLK